MGQFALVDDRAVLKQLVAAMGQRKQSRDAWDSAGRLAESDTGLQVFYDRRVFWGRGTFD